MISNFRLPFANFSKAAPAERLGEFIVRLEETKMKIGNRKSAIGNQP